MVLLSKVPLKHFHLMPIRVEHNRIKAKHTKEYGSTRQYSCDKMNGAAPSQIYKTNISLDTNEKGLRKINPQ
jgi:hypothetical protein